MKDQLDQLASEVKSITIKTCIKTAQLLKLPRAGNDYQRGYNDAVKEITAQIKRLL